MRDALRTLQGWTDQVVVLDDGSTDRTAEIAREHGALVLPVGNTETANASTPKPPTARFDSLRNRVVEHSTCAWIFVLDADERVPAGLGPILKDLLRDHGEEFEAVVLPFKHYFCGRWMQHSGWGLPGYCRPQLLKKGRFAYGRDLHSGVQVDGRTVFFPADDPELAIVHHSYDDLHHYLGKLSRYTTGEALTMWEKGHSPSWQAMLAHFVHDWQVYYEQNRADLDGMHGFVLAFFSAFYRFSQQAKLWDLCRQKGEANPTIEVPRDLREMLEFMARVCQQGADGWLQPTGASRLAAAPYTTYDGIIRPSYQDEMPACANAEAAPSNLGPCGSHSSVRLSPDSPISAVILARNEERRLPECLRSLQGWVREIVLLNHGSTDGSAGVANRYGGKVIPVPFEPPGGAAVEGNGKGHSFDGLRNLAIPHCTGEWVLIIDADERVPPRLAERFLKLAHEGTHDAYAGPFKNYFCGKWMQYGGWYPGYIHLQLLRKEKFHCNEGVHGGIHVDGTTSYLPADDPDLATLHLTYDDLIEYLEKLNRYTDVEAEKHMVEGASHSWQAMLAIFVDEWQKYYEQGRSDLDGLHGFVLSFHSAFYRLASRAKLWDLRRKRGETDPSEPVPRDLREMLEFMARVHQQGAERWLSPRKAAPLSPRSELGHAPKPRTASSSSCPPSVIGETRVPLVWRSPLFDPSGYADEARQFVLGLIEAGETVTVCPEQWAGSAELEPAVRSLLEKRAVSKEQSCELLVSHTLPGLQEPSRAARFNIARTMFETDSLPPAFVEKLNRMDRVWVPSEFNYESFVRSGVEPGKIVVIPGAIDPQPYHGSVDPYPLPFFRSGPRPFVFLSVFDWSLHKGWDVLLEAFAREFDNHVDATLLIKTWSTNHYSLVDARSQADAFLRSRLGRGLDAFPNIQLWEERIAAGEMPRLYRAANAFLLPTRGEGWCRPLMEAMASGLPTIATAWSGLTAFHDAEVGYPLRHRLMPVAEAGYREIPIYAGQCWAEPDVSDLQRLMRRTLEEPEEARRKGEAAQQRMRERFSRGAVAELVRAELARCRELARQGHPSVSLKAGANGKPPNGAASVQVPLSSPVRPQRDVEATARTAPTPPPFLPSAFPLAREQAEPVDYRSVLGRPLRVQWEGDQSLLSSLALVNRELCLALVAAGDVELSLAEERGPWHVLSERDDLRFGPLFACRGATLSGPADVTVRHHFPPNWERPQSGKLVVMQPWEYGHLPKEWVREAAAADEVWAYSRWVREVYARSGVPAEKVRIVPLGFNPDVFTQTGPVFPISSRGGSSAVRPDTRFLFVGGALDRKGADLLLRAYLHAFDASDEVCLIVKDMGTRTFYRNGTLGKAFRQAEEDPRTAPVVYLDDDLSTEQIAALYRACSCVVLPYRGEGFCLPPLEGMACGIPAIVTGGGPTDDYVDNETGCRLPYRRRMRGKNAVGFEDSFECVGDPWQLEPDFEALVSALRWAHAHPDELRRKGEAARRWVAEDWTWSAAGEIVRGRLLRVIGGHGSKVPRQLEARPWAPRRSERRDDRTSAPAGAPSLPRIRPLSRPSARPSSHRKA